MRYSLNEIISRLYLKNSMDIKNQNSKITVLKKIFEIEGHISKSTLIDSLYNANYDRIKTTDCPPLKKDSTTSCLIQSQFNQDNYCQALFCNVQNFVWNSLQSKTKELLREHRKDIFADFRFDTVTHKPLDENLIKIIEILLESESENSFIYVILLFILIAIFHEDITTQPVCIVLKEETIESILNIGFSKNKYPAPILNTLNGVVTTEHSVPFVHEQYKKFAVYLYNDHGESTTDFCSGNIEFSANGIVNLSFQDKPLNKTIHYNGTAHLFKENRLVYIILENEQTHRGAIICFHFTEFKEDPKCYLRKGLFTSTAEGDEHHRPFVKNIIFLHQESEQQELIEGLLKCCDMRESDEFIIIRDKKLTQFINKLYEFDFMDSLKDDRTYFEKFLRKYSAVTDTDENAYCLIRENSFHDWLKEHYPDEVDELQRKTVLLMLKYFSELPNAIYPYTTKDTTYHIFK